MPDKKPPDDCLNLMCVQCHHRPLARFPQRDAPGAPPIGSRSQPTLSVDVPLKSQTPRQVSTLTAMRPRRTLSLWNCCPWAVAWGAGVWPCIPAGPWACTAGLWWCAGPPWTAGLEVCPWPALFWAALGTWRNRGRYEGWAVPPEKCGVFL